MPRSYLDPPTPIMALATPEGRSALAVLRGSGAGCVELLGHCFSKPAALQAVPGHRLVHGEFRDPATDEAIDEIVVGVFRAPRSPTGEEQFELSCHGSPAVVRRILSCLESIGFSPALPGEFSFRAFANGKGDLVHAEAIDEIVAARSDGARAAALDRLAGGLSHRLDHARAGLLGLLAEAEVRLDYAEEDGSPATLFPRASLIQARRDLAGLAASWKAGRLYGEGARIALAGPTNAGKSSLFNLFLREERAIVSAEPGTTRDWIEAGMEIGGFPVRLIDTAGLRADRQAVEALGIERTMNLVREAELLLCIVDSTVGPASEVAEILALRPDALRVWNKVDLPDARPCPEGWLRFSAASGEGFSSVLRSCEEALARLAGLEAKSPAQESAIVANLRQKRLLDRSVLALDSALAILDAAEGGAMEWLDAATLELRDAADALGEITGEISSPEVLEAIFAGFCLGK